MRIDFILAVLICAVLSYLIGSCNSAIITVKIMKGEDIREFGSGNAGLTNTLRCFGKLPALFTLLGDLLKGIVAVILCRIICTLMEVGLGPENDVHFIGYVAGLAAVLGHIFPIYYKFKGGKGVLVGVSVFVVIDPLLFAILILIFAVILSISKYVSLSSIIATTCCPVGTFLLHYFLNEQSVQLSLLYTLMTIPICFIVIFMHKSNIQRLKNGTENRFSFGGKKEK
ncbi:MAG: glycerol-3-phosphate 1-O-acyltransferase PlsY [Ruminococcus sp.]|nr:glycerol-3-phosphate 1-O-acyltransferase PlsY [Ruminococcus sp.]